MGRLGYDLVARIGRFLGALADGLIDFLHGATRLFGHTGSQRQTIIALALVVFCYVCLQAFGPRPKE
jgi:hypothetical protein